MKFKITFLLPLSLFVYTISMRQKITISSFVRDRSFPFNDTIRYIASFNAENLSAKGNTRLNLFMQQSTGNLAEIVISTNKNNSNVQHPEMSLIHVPSPAAKKLSGLLEDRNVLKIIQLPNEERREERRRRSVVTQA